MILTRKGLVVRKCMFDEIKLQLPQNVSGFFNLKIPQITVKNI